MTTPICPTAGTAAVAAARAAIRSPDFQFVRILKASFSYCLLDANPTFAIKFRGYFFNTGFNKFNTFRATTSFPFEVA
jgi:hypothetical protein